MPRKWIFVLFFESPRGSVPSPPPPLQRTLEKHCCRNAGEFCRPPTKRAFRHGPGSSLSSLLSSFRSSLPRHGQCPDLSMHQSCPVFGAHPTSHHARFLSRR